MGYQKNKADEEREDSEAGWAFVAERFWRDTEPDFHRILAAIKTAHENNPRDPDVQIPLFEAWAVVLRGVALSLFDEYSPIDAAGNGDMERAITARYSLSTTFRGYGKSGAAFFKELELVPPEVKKSRATAKEKA